MVIIFLNFKVNNLIVFSIFVENIMLIFVFMGGVDILLKFYKKRNFVVYRKCCFIENEKLEFKYVVKVVFISFINL